MNAAAIRMSMPFEMVLDLLFCENHWSRTYRNPFEEKTEGDVQSMS